MAPFRKDVKVISDMETHDANLAARAGDGTIAGACSVMDPAQTAHFGIEGGTATR
jgi:hypothetical protein